MEQLTDEIAELRSAQHLRRAPCRKPAHMRAGRVARPQHARWSGPLHMAPEAVRIARTAPPVPVSTSMLVNAAFVRRLLVNGRTQVWPVDIAERVTSSSVWPSDVRSCITGPVGECAHELLYATPSDFALAHRRAMYINNVESYPYWVSRWQLARENLVKPVPIGIAAGLAAVLAISQTPHATQTDVALASTDRTADDTASRGIPREYLLASVQTPAPGPTTTTTTQPPPTTTTPPPPPTTAKPKPVVRPPATVPSSTSQCSSSKAAAHACWDGLLAQYSWNTTSAFNVMWCESTGNPNAKNPRSTATGLFQILNGPYDPAANVKLAYDMYSKRGWQPWVCKP